VKVPRHLTSRNPEPRSIESAQSRAHGFGAWSQRNMPGEGALTFIIWQGGSRSAESDLSRPSHRDTWCAIRLFAFSPIATSKLKEKLLHILETRSAESIQDPSPQYHGAVSAVHPRGTRGARLGSSPFRPSRLRSTRSSSLPSTRREVPMASGTGDHSIAK
jgi:hypothetical protein